MVVVVRLRRDVVDPRRVLFILISLTTTRCASASSLLVGEMRRFRRRYELELADVFLFFQFFSYYNLLSWRDLIEVVAVGVEVGVSGFFVSVVYGL